MIRGIVRGSVKLRGLVIGLAATILAVGVATLPDAPADVYPEFTPPYVEIQTESLGLSAAEVEQLITVPLEADLLNGVEGVDVIRSSSTPGLSSIVLVFEPGFDVYKGRQLVQERLTQLGGAAFPNVSKPAVMLPPLSSSSRVMMIGLDSDELSPIQQSVIARWTTSPRLMGVQGVANVAVWGMRDQQIQVQVDPGEAAQGERHAQPGHPYGRKRADRLADQLPRGIGARYRWLHRDTVTAAPHPQRLRQHRQSGDARQGAGRGHTQGAPATSPTSPTWSRRTSR